jgi:hypothetical protein
MGKPRVRLNPRVDSIRNRVLLNKGAEILLSAALMLPPQPYGGRGRKPYDYRLMLVLCLLRILLRKRYSDYESEMRFDTRLMQMLNIPVLPCKSTVNNYAFTFSLAFLSKFNLRLVDSWIKKPVDLLLDASGIRVVGRSIWYCIRIGKKIGKRDCDKLHASVEHHTLLIANFKVSNSKRNDSPFLRKLLAPFIELGLVLADKGYSGKINTLFVANKRGAFFCPIKINAIPSGFNAWHCLSILWKVFPRVCDGIYHHRSRVEAVFAAIKKRYGDKLYSSYWFTRRRELAMIIIAYNVRVIIGIMIAREKGIPLWVRA